MEEESFSFFDEVVAETLLLSNSALDLYGPCRAELLVKWEETLTMTVVSHDGFLDWGQTRDLFWTYVHKQTMVNVNFRKAIGSILVELYGQSEGMRGFRVIFAPQFR